MKKITGLLIFIVLMQHQSATAQSFAINTDGSAAHASAILDVKSTNKGLLIPRLTTAQRTSIASPGKGLLVYDSTLKNFYFHDGIVWQQISADSNNLWRKNGNDIYNSNTGNVGIGTATPLSTLHVKRGAVLFDGILYDNTIGTTPVSGSGTRMMWIPEKGAFRAGTTSFSGWDDVNIGYNSTAIGYNTVASGDYSTATGRGGLASGDYSTAMGNGSVANGDYSTAMGNGTVASGDYSTAMGWGSAASGNYSTATGFYNKAKSYGGFVTGHYNDTAIAADPLNINSLNRIFQIGNGIANSARSNALTVLQNGNAGIGTTTPQSLLHVKRGAVLFDSTIGSTPVSGAGTRMMWIPAKASFRGGRVDESYSNYWDEDSIGWGSFAFGHNSKATGGYSVAMGVRASADSYSSVSMGQVTKASGSSSTAFGALTLASGVASTALGGSTVASGNLSTAMGSHTTASGITSTAMGSYTTASGENSTAMGSGSYASGRTSTAMGFGTKSKSFGGFLTGLYNDSTDAASPITINSLNRIFQIGNGTADNARSNAMTVLQNGNIGIGELNPTSPLNFASTVGDKIALWGNGANHYGFGIQASLLQVYTMDAGNDIAFGYGNSAAFTENVRIKGNGNVGIGTVNPVVPLNFSTSLGDKIALWSNGTTHYGLGLQPFLMQLYTEASTSDIAFGYGNSAAFTENVRIKGNGNVGVGTSTPLASLHVRNGAVLVDGTIGSTPVSGAGIRMMWIPAKAAFRGGEVASTQWDDVNIGYYSTAMGYNTYASGISSIAMGWASTASGSISTAIGNFSKSKSFGGFVTGLYNDSSNAASPTNINSLNRIFQIGNGTADNARSNAMTVLQNGNIGIGELNPTSPLDVNGTTTTNGLQVSNGTVITKMQSGSVTVGANGTGQLVYVINFPVAFATAIPRVFATARNAPATNFSDAFSVSVRSVSATSVTLNIQRTDTNAGWGQLLRVDWFAVE